MKNLKTLIKLKKKDIDELKKRKSVFENMRQEFVGETTLLKMQLEEETKLATELADLRGFFGDYSKHIGDKQEKFAEDIARLDKKIDILTDEMGEHFAQMKKYEIALENRKLAIKKKRQKKEQDMLDEVAARKKRL